MPPLFWPGFMYKKNPDKLYSKKANLLSKV